MPKISSVSAFLCLWLMSGSFAAIAESSSHPDYRVLTYQTRSVGESQRLLTTRVEARAGKRDLSGDRLVVVQSHTFESHAARFLVPESSRDALAALWDVPPSELASWMHRDFWAPLSVGSQSLGKRFAIEPPSFAIDIVVVPHDFKFERKFSSRVDVPDLAMTIGMNLPHSTAENQLLNVFFQSAGTALHEALHMLESYGEPYSYAPANRVSSEANAYFFASCALATAGTTPHPMSTAGIPVEDSTARRFYLSSSRDFLKAAQRALRAEAGMLDSGKRGSLLASLALWEATGGQRNLQGPAAERFEQLCAAATATEMDWLATRPCQNERLKQYCQPLED